MSSLAQVDSRKQIENFLGLPNFSMCFSTLVKKKAMKIVSFLCSTIRFVDKTVKTTLPLPRNIFVILSVIA